MIHFWNTGRQYTAQGQRIMAKAVPGGLIFVDHDRQIDGFVPGDFVGDVRTRVMTAYDTNAYRDPITTEQRDALRALWKAPFPFHPAH